MKFALPLISERDLRDTLSRFLLASKIHRPKLTSALLFLVVVCLQIVSYLLFEHYIRTKRIPLSALRGFVTNTINQELGKAVDLGVLDFSIREGLILEDLAISQEEDFSYNSYLLKVKKVTFHIESYFAKVPQIDRIDFYSPQLILNNDENLETSLIKYFKSSRIKEVIFHDTRVTLIKDNEIIVDWKEGWDIHFKREGEKIFVSYSNGMFWIPNATRIKGQGYLSETKEEDFSFQLEWKNYPSEEAPLLSKYLLGANLQSAVLSGDATWTRLSDGSNLIKGNVEFENTTFTFPLVSSYIVSGFRFQESFLFQKDQELREFTTRDFLLKWEIQKLQGPKEILLVRKVQFDIEDIASLSDYLIDIASGESLPIAGKVRGNIDIKETGEKDRWFQVRGDIKGEDLSYGSTSFLFKEGQFEINVSDQNQTKLNLKGELFNKPVQFNLTSILEWSRSKKTDGTFYYPLSSKTKANLVLKELIASDWIPLYQNWKQDTLEEIKERQEKLIPEEYFYQKKLYKYFLETLAWESGIQVDSYYPFEGSGSLGPLKGSLLAKDGRFSFNVNLPNNESKMSIGSYYATKTPNFSFSLFLKAYPWGTSWMSLCGMELNPEKIEFDYSYNSQGSDYYTLSKDARYSYFVKLISTKVTNKEIISKLNLSEKILKDPFDLEFNLDHYFDSDYARNIVLTSPTLDIKGYAQNKSGQFYYSVYGLLGEVRSSWSITEDENRRCSIK
ncbi:hypothetical protein LPTSP4_02680 [Leptospira ryugenii]|uniref:DUF3971 domain-containing protein n=1 Tax=Leptospira ryugenii TaxID=1917863 RepID=A0A2P2DVV5_9LEPT|nr:hypothetical protein [Leptospira ryugenii]GBF48768.1 hypothetical protein LPTSP4_02680 [Leptospira ryugenii]